MEREKMLYEMMEEYHKGKTVQEVVLEYLGEEAEKNCADIQETIHNFHSCVSSMMKQYDETDLQLIVFTEIDRLYPDDASKQFAAFSKLKYQNILRSIELGEDRLREESYEVEFLREAAQKAYENEQSMAEEATWEEVAELQTELIPFLVNHGDRLQDAMKQNKEEWEPILEKLEILKKMETSVLDSVKEDIETMVAAALLEEDSTVSIEEAAKSAIYQIWLGHMQTWKELCLLDLAFLEAGAVVELMGIATGAAFLNGIGGVLIGGSLLGLGLLAVAALGAGASYAAEKLVPAAEKAWSKTRPWMEKAAEQVKRTVARMIGFMANKVIRPAVYWVKNSAVPAVKENVYYPLRRRLQAMLAWIGEKAEQVKDFVIRAAASTDWNEEEAWNAERYAYETGYETEMESEAETEPAEKQDAEAAAEAESIEETEEEAEEQIGEEAEPESDVEAEVELQAEAAEEANESAKTQTEKENVNLSFA